MQNPFDEFDAEKPDGKDSTNLEARPRVPEAIDMTPEMPPKKRKLPGIGLSDDDTQA